jgi:hypothetical protein
VKEVTKEKTVSGKGKNIICSSCEEVGHHASKCPQKTRGDKKSKGSGDNSLFVHLEQNEDKPSGDVPKETRETNFCVVQGELDGQPVSILHG